MTINDQQIDSIIDRVVGQLASVDKPNMVRSVPRPVAQSNNDESDLSMRGCFFDIESAIAAAKQAFAEYQLVRVEDRKKIIDMIRIVCSENLSKIAKLAWEETGLGRYEDKIKKNELAIRKTPGVEDLKPEAFTGDDGLTLMELAPHGVIGSITPCTNPSETIISNTIGMIAGGNVVVFNPHPSAKKTSIYTINLINQAIISAGGPPNLVTTVSNPTIESAQVMMNHVDINLLVVTGGPAVVAVAMKSGKKVIAAGPGNPPVVVDETADIEKAAKDIVTSASTDNNIICIVEKNIIATPKAADALKKALVKHGAVELNSHQARRLKEIILDGDHPHKKWIGKDIQIILKEIGMDVESHKRLAITEVDEQHPFAQLELLMPVLPFIRAKSFDDAVDIAYRLEGGRFHTAVIHSKNIEHLHQMARRMNTAIFVKNGPALAGLGLGGEGSTSFTVASPTGEGVTTARHFVRIRRCVLSDGYFRIT
ncbi:MAG: aldehyde dehydrogenase EutE [Gammaproteobacteria bacterium RIFCSPHIGHO2_02_FULL_42_13]|nr:MAG: aldehyde dehydrogenase EutE [Gammaproteobacteria bacterium RIFCSPHIGHO2_02_FULL_42_13]OGT70748.1 MAG: aldehyde dehydrogenase EutE [Gammaproteobacteria bacterium RIFCSPLOWO2_02_FULL_42_9]